jgi:capsule polysaccharide export protein KpsE/RkpR
LIPLKGTSKQKKLVVLKQTNNFSSNINLIHLLWKWKKHIIAIVILSIILAVIFSSPYFIPPRYKSNAIVYPAVLNPFASENESEQMLQWLESRDIADSVIKKFNLGEHYHISATDKHYNSKIYRTFQRNLVLSSTRFESVKIEITDQDPQMACDMVTAMINFYNKKVNEAHRKKYREILQLEEAKLKNKKTQLDSLMAKIIDIRMNHGLIDYGIQTSEVTRGYLGTFEGSNMANVNYNEIERLKGNIERYGDSLLLLTNLLSGVTHSYSNYLISYEDALRNVNKEMSFASVVSSPAPADRKSYPVRWAIVLLSAIGALLFSLIVILTIELQDFINQNK